MAYIVSIGFTDAAVRDANAVRRETNTAIVSRTSTTPRKNTTDVSRAATSRVARSATSPGRSATTPRNFTPVSTSHSVVSARSSSNINTRGQTQKNTTARNTARATSTHETTTNTFGSGYNTCRDAYFTCMDQFCATQNDTYRRCICSSRLNEIKYQERLLSQTSDQLQDFKDLNLNVIDKSSGEVSAMLTATVGEAIASTAKDTSESGKTLDNISTILSKTKNKSLSTAGQLDIGGDIQQIWQTTDLTGGANISNLSGEALYNAVHAQCSEMVTDACDSKTTLNMVASAYGMYIENDCSLLSNSLDSKITKSKGDVRETEREMHSARLENYNEHNSTAIHECIANVRTDLTANTACGENFIHCWDISGRYLNRETGEPIYSPEFYELGIQTSLSGNILSNQTNRLIVAELNRMRTFASTSLDSCRDIADEVWDEFMRQSITEIYQAQQDKIRTVKNECLDVVNNCYDTQSQSLKDFSNIKEQLLLGQRLELSEQLCTEKLAACSNLYGGGTSGLNELIKTMTDINDAKIAKECLTTLREFAQDICAVPSNDTLHSYPYSCRFYNPGSQQYAHLRQCNISNKQNSETDTISPFIDIGTYYKQCSFTDKVYTSCKGGYCLNDKHQCISGKKKEGSQECDTSAEADIDCGDYPGSLYQRIVSYAMEVCIRPSHTGEIPTELLQDANVVMDSIRVDMGKELAKQCESLGGQWVDTKWIDNNEPNDKHDITGDEVHDLFYNETGANTEWGYCKPLTTE